MTEAANHKAPTRVRRDGAATRERLLDVAETLFAARGIGAVSLREVGLAAGQRNTRVAAYHFGDRHGLVDALIRRGIDETAAHMAEILSTLALGDQVDPWMALARVIVAPLAAPVRRGSHFIGFYARLLLDHGPEEHREARMSRAQAGWSRLIELTASMRPDLSRADVEWRVTYAACSAIFELARLTAEIDRNPLTQPRIDRTEDQLTKSVSAIFQAA